MSNPVVYFLIAETVVKIGTTTKLPSRVATIRTACPELIENVFVVPGGPLEERILHAMFQPHRRRGEWFARCDEIVAFCGKFCVSVDARSHPSPHNMLAVETVRAMNLVSGWLIDVPAWASDTDEVTVIRDPVALAKIEKREADARWCMEKIVADKRAQESRLLREEAGRAMAIEYGYLPDPEIAWRRAQGYRP